MNSITIPEDSPLSFFQKYAGCVLILLTIIGFISKSWYNYPVAVMAIIGAYRLLKNPQLLQQDKLVRFFVFSFLCLWLPLLLSLPDAVNPGHSSQTIFPYLRFLFAGIFIILEVHDQNKLKVVVTSVFAIVTFWCLDGMLQFFIGRDIFGFAYHDPDVTHGLTGAFYPRYAISHICSILFCFVLLYSLHRKRWWAIISTILPLIFITFIAGKRAAWVMLVLSGIGYLLLLSVYSKFKKRLILMVFLVTALIGLMLTVTIFFHEPSKIKVTNTLGLFSLNYQTFNKATSLRLPLWKTAYRIFDSNRINGIGPRGYRYVYQDYSSPEDYYYKLGQTHPHLLILELMAETGLIGLGGYLLFVIVLIQSIICTANKQKVLPFFIPVAVALFPLNAHMAFYGSVWSTMIWWLFAIYVASLRIQHNSYADKPMVNKCEF